VQRTGDGHTGRVLSGRAIERSGDFVCDLYRAQGDKECGFLGCNSKPRSTFVSGLASKSLGWFVCGLTSKPLGWFSLT
jgi:hypothetical protein